MEIQAKQILVVPDIHQDIAWFDRVIKDANGRYEHIVFLGDILDEKSKFAASKKDTCEFILRIHRGEFGPFTQLLGNHDAQYMESCKANLQYSQMRWRRYACGRFSNNRSIAINKIIHETWKDVKLFARYGNYVLSHAGIGPHLWDFRLTREHNFEILANEADKALVTIDSANHRMLVASVHRGGLYPHAGLTWQCFENDFADFPEIGKQIVGHTRFDTPAFKGNSVCIDCKQTYYVLLDASGNIEFRKI